MGIFRKVGDWLTEKSDRFIRGESEMSNGYYGSREAEQAYSNMGAEQPEADHGDMEAGEDTEHKPSGDPFGYGGGEYGGRVPYRSRYDREREAQQQPQQPPYQQQPSVQQPIQAQGMQMGMQPPVQRPMAQQQMNMGQQPGYAQGYAQQPMGNVVPFPGMQRGQDGSVYAHVEYIVLLRSRNECKDVIAYIKLNASVFLNMEFIASDNERQRCVDMLSGAAYTLGCALNKISPRGIYLISSPSVRVVLDPAMQKFASAPEAQGFVRQRYENENYQGYSGYQQGEAAQETQRQRPVTGFSSGSPTTRFQAQGTQRTPPASFGSVMAGNVTSSYSPAGGMGSGNAPTGRYSVGPQ